MYKAFAKKGQSITFIRDDSHNQNTVEQVRTILKGRTIDFLFIDGDHTYDGVETDYRLYSSLVGPRGIIAFHDIVPHPPETECQVDKLWQEVKSHYQHREIVEDWEQGWAGIGVLFVEGATAA